MGKQDEALAEISNHPEVTGCLLYDPQLRQYCAIDYEMGKAYSDLSESGGTYSMYPRICDNVVTIVAPIPL